MLEMKFIRENIKKVKENIKNKNKEYLLPLVDEVIKLDEEYRQNIQLANDLKHKRNTVTDKISENKQKGLPIDDLLAEARLLPEKIKVIDDKQRELYEKIIDIQKKIPNIISKKTPIGKDETENKEVKRFGEPKKLDFEVINHGEIAEMLNIADFEASRNVSGKGFYYLKGDLALLNRALINYASDFLHKKGYVYVLPPQMINKRACEGSVDFTFFRDMAYKIEDEDLYLIATSEHPLISMFVDKTIDEEKLPIKIFSFSSCFRKEIGSHGLDERGLFRLHQFDKVEQIIICKPEESEKAYNELLKNTVKLFVSLELPTRILESCTGDLGDLKHRGADVEVWSPRNNKYIEVASCSNLTSAQAVRLNIKAKTRQGEKYYVHTLNDTAIATSRALVAILENHQTKEGTIKIPKVLQKYMYGKTEIKKNDIF
ncbi:MAG TPA: serine--tRNA ligase [archaeon]|jgi:seryl-tRNA synthetase|nr:serine--tRNA ligase [archaeon]HPV66557.1 serine--tRNA ligase [archaeon]